jgi:DNA mismatch repair protein MSH4
MSVASRKFKRKRGIIGDGPLDLEAKVAESGGDASYGLELSTMGDENDFRSTVGDSGIYGGRRSVASKSAASRRSRRSFRQSKMRRRPSTGQRSLASSARNPYRQSSSRLKRSSSSRMDSSVRSQSGRTTRVLRTSIVEKTAVHIVCAIGENLARETCVASLDAGTPICLQVTKQGNGQTYAETIAYLEMLQPHEVLLNEGRQNSHLAQKILQLFSKNTSHDNSGQSTLPGDDQQHDSTTRLQSGPCETSTVVKFISRSCFDQTKGAALLRRLSRQETYDASLVEEYILLSSAHAVLQYTQQALGVSFSRNYLDISVNSGGKNRMAIDRSTIMQLELLSNAKTGKTQNTLISTIDCTKTTVGSRLLRTNLIAPPCRIDTIISRLDLVDTFLEDEEFFYSVLEHLESLPAVDKMLTNVAVVPRKSGGADIPNKIAVRLASKGISALVCIKSTLTALPALASLLKDHLESLEQQQDQSAGLSVETSRAKDSDDAFSAFTSRSGLLTGLGSGPGSSDKPQRNQLLKAIIYAFSRPDLAEIQETVASVFTPSTNFSRSANTMRHQECFALKSADNGMMDILRKAFLANVDDIYKRADEYAELHSIHVSVKYSASRGYYLSVPAELASGLPKNFIQPAKSGKFIHCTTEEVHSLNIRAQDNVQDLLLMTRDKIHEVLEFARSKYDALAALSDAVALLDLCHSFADNVTLNKLPWCRPAITLSVNERNEDSNDSDAVALAIRNGRYAIDVEGSFLASAEGPHEIIPNDTYAKDGQCFTLITGINGSGKSTYLKQVGIIVLLAHCGSYVPAEHASIPVSCYAIWWLLFFFQEDASQHKTTAQDTPLCKDGNVG